MTYEELKVQELEVQCATLRIALENAINELQGEYGEWAHDVSSAQYEVLENLRKILEGGTVDTVETIIKQRDQARLEAESFVHVATEAEGKCVELIERNDALRNELEQEKQAHSAHYRVAIMGFLAVSLILLLRFI
jgi:hypothetical protein